MPKKRPPAPDNALFRERVLFCAERVGNQNQLAIKSGVPQSTIRSYFEGVEPPRDFLVAIARAANVSVGWLVAGVEPFERTAPETVPVDEDLMRVIREHMDMAAKNSESYETLATRSGINPQDLDAIRFARPPTVFELVAIARGGGIDIREMLGLLKEPMPSSQPTNRDSAKPDISVAHGPIRQFPISTSLKMMAMIDALLKRFEAEPHRYFTQEDDTMATSVLQNDVAIVKEQNAITIPDCYLFQSGNRQFIARAVPRDDAMMLSYDNPNYNRVGEQRYNPQKHLCLGRVVARLTSTKPN